MSSFGASTEVAQEIIFMGGYNAQCFYREGHAYIVKNPIACLMGPTTKFV